MLGGRALEEAFGKLMSGLTAIVNYCYCSGVLLPDL